MAVRKTAQAVALGCVVFWGWSCHPVSLGDEPVLGEVAKPLEVTSEGGSRQPAVLADVPDASQAADDLDRLLEMAETDVESLSKVNVSSAGPPVSMAAPSIRTEVTTVSRQKSTIGKSPAAVFVITNEMIRRSGARSIPDALRMAPGVQVARIDSNKWAVTIRGFNGRFSNKLLVQIDGRTVYTPLFGGVFWDVQDVLLEDIERIEVIRGPGATIWGANAVNGIINIITKSSSDTQGTYAEVGGGTHEKAFVGGRYGGQLGEHAHYRLYGKWFERARGANLPNPFSPVGNNQDDWRIGRGGGRIDWTPTPIDTVTVQSDFYQGFTGRRNYAPHPSPALPSPFFTPRDDDAKVAGGNILTRWTRRLSADSDWSFQAYYDRTQREFLATGFREGRDTVDVDFQYRWLWGDNHRMICGAGYRNTRDKLRSLPFAVSWQHPRRSDDLFSYFIQDEINLYQERWFLTAGSKFQHNDYTGFEVQPTARLLWLPDDRRSCWAAVSRAVRTPTRSDDDIRATLHQQSGVFPRLFGSRTFASEEVVAYELGFRAQPTDRFSWDLALFYNQYDNLTALPRGTPFVDTSSVPPVTVLPIFLTNGQSGQTSGFELFGSYECSRNWRMFCSYSYIDFDVNEGLTYDSTRNQLYLQSSWDAGQHWHWDFVWRYVDALLFQDVPAYNTADVRLAWTRGNVEFVLAGRNLLEPVHQEFGFDVITGNSATGVRREFYGMLSLRY